MTTDNVKTIGEGSVLTYEWTEGGFSGNVYEVTLLPEGKLSWRGVEGSEAGQSATEDQVTVREVAPGVTQVAWLEDFEAFGELLGRLDMSEDRCFIDSACPATGPRPPRVTAPSQGSVRLPALTATSRSAGPRISEKRAMA